MIASPTQGTFPELQNRYNLFFFSLFHFFAPIRILPMREVANGKTERKKKQNKVGANASWSGARDNFPCFETDLIYSFFRFSFPSLQFAFFTRAN